MRIVLTFLIAGLSGAASALAQPLDVDGVWLSQKGDGHIRISDCGDGAPCGVLTWVDPSSPGGGLDAKNPNPSLRTRPLVGVPVVWGFERRNGAWVSGRIYNPEDGKTFYSELRLRGSDILEVKGCFGPLCRTNLWTRVSNGGAGQ